MFVAILWIFNHNYDDFGGKGVIGVIVEEEDGDDDDVNAWNKRSSKFLIFNFSSWTAIIIFGIFRESFFFSFSSSSRELFESSFLLFVFNILFSISSSVKRDLFFDLLLFNEGE